MRGIVNHSLLYMYTHRPTALLLANYLVVIFTIISVTFACIPLNSELNMVQEQHGLTE